MYPHPQIWRPLAVVTTLVAASLLATSTVTIEEGDTLSEIAARHDVSVADLMEWNDLDDADRIFAGATLIVSPPETSAGTSGSSAGHHVVTAGDTLSAIAARFGTSVATLVAANGIDDPDRIIVGQTLALSTTTTTTAPPRTHTVVAGDTLSTIAARYGVKTGVLAAENGIADPDLIVVGMVLTIGDSPAPSTPAPPTPVPATPVSTTTIPTTTVPTTTVPPSTTPTNTVRPADEILLGPMFTKWADVYRVPQDLIEAIAWKESTWRPAAVGPNGHLGIMQLSPDTVALIEGGLLGRDMDPLDADNGIQMGARFLRYLLDRTDSEAEAVAAWVQGLRGVQRDGISSAGAAYVAAIEEIRRQRS